MDCCPCVQLLFTALIAMNIISCGCKTGSVERHVWKKYVHYVSEHTMTKEAQRGRRWWWKVELKSFSCTRRFVSSLQSARSKCSVLSPCSFSNNKAAVLFYGTIQLLFQALPANNIKCGCLSSCAQCEVLLAGEEGGGTKLSTNTLHAARQLVSLELLWLGLKKKVMAQWEPGIGIMV